MISHTILGASPPLRRTTASLSIAAVLLWPVGCLAQGLPLTHLADPADPTDLAVLHASSDQIERGTIRNSCDSVVHPVISYPAPGVAVHIEKDPTGICSGSSPPSTLTVLLKTGPAWRVSTSTTGSSFRLGRVQSGYPEIVVEYPPSQKDCPVLGWKGKDYDMSKSCLGGRGQ